MPHDHEASHPPPSSSQTASAPPRHSSLIHNCESKQSTEPTLFESFHQAPSYQSPHT
ncbi:hypothetical protein Syun_004117 [Stephania yunnanensis]|uniref:Uncharacterized protein n=1 Tax=Stephania yunnanensis TaxID=152371 RepID=A0AAP0L4Z6_9MAGN